MEMSKGKICARCELFKYTESLTLNLETKKYDKEYGLSCSLIFYPKTLCKTDKDSFELPSFCPFKDLHK